MLKNRISNKKNRRKSSHRQYEDEFRYRLDQLIKNDPNALTSVRYQNLLEEYNSRVIGSSSSNIEVISTNEGVQVVRKDRVESKTAISRIFSEDNEDSKSNSFVKNIFFYIITALIFWIFKEFF